MTLGRKCLVLVWVLALLPASLPALSFDQLYQECLDEGQKGQDALEYANLRWMGGNTEEVCDSLDRARAAFSTAYQDLAKMQDMLDAATGVDPDLVRKWHRWFAKQRSDFEDISAAMEDNWGNVCH